MIPQLWVGQNCVYWTKAGEILRKHGAEVVAVGRLRWFREGDPRDKGNDPMDNFVWVKLVPHPFGGIIFWPRAAK